MIVEGKLVGKDGTIFENCDDVYDTIRDILDEEFYDAAVCRFHEIYGITIDELDRFLNESQMKG